MSKGYKGYKKNGVLLFLECALNCDIQDTMTERDSLDSLSVKDARKILNDCPLDTIVGGYCRRFIDNAAIPADRIRETLGDESNELQHFLDAVIYTCVITITG